MFETLGIACQAAQKAQGSVPVGELRDGTPVALPVRVICGRHDGPVVTFTGSVHGDEPYGMAAINRVFDAVDPNELRGVLIGFPIANPFAVMTKSRISGLDYERLNLNRVFPGNANGLITERLAATIFEGGIRKADCHLDYHEGGYDFIAEYLIAHRMPDKPRVSEESLRLAQAFGMGVPINNAPVRPESLRIGYGGASTIQANAIEIPSMASELGGAGRVWPHYVDMGVAGTLNVLKEVGALPGAKTTVERPQFIAHQSDWPRPAKGGWWENAVELGQVVEAGQEVGYVRDAFGSIVESLVAPYKSVILDIRNTAMIMTGEWTVHCGRLA